MNTHRIDDDSTTLAVVRAVAAYVDTPVDELEPLYESIDPEALDSLLREVSEIHITFEYHGVTVHVDPECIRIDGPADPDSTA